MKITNVRIRELEGTMEHPGTFWEERLRMPMDIYPEFKMKGAEIGVSHLPTFPAPAGNMPPPSVCLLTRLLW